MTNKIFIYLVLSTFFSLFALRAQAQIAGEVDHSYKPLTMRLNEDGSKYVRFIMWHQIWATTNNLEVENTKLQITPSIRRSRFLAFAQISPKFLILTHFGLNGLTPSNQTSLGNNGDSPQLFLHGAWGELQINKSLYVGAGLHYWNGLTRLSSQSTLNFMTLDQSRPFVSWHSIGISDQFARHLGVYAKGNIGKFDYRLSINSPGRSPLGAGRDYGLKDSGLTYTGVSNTNSAGDPTGNTVLMGYFRYNIFDSESTKLPYSVGTYLGKKKVLALGAGFFSHPNAMYDEANQSHSHVNHFAVDGFLDMPVSGGAINAYLSYLNFNYGQNYVSRWGGTGNAVYGQLGYYLKTAKIMPYAAFQSGNYEGLDAPITALDVGLNYFINGHNAKVTLEYHRIKGDIREAAIASSEDALSQIRLQLHVFL
ncbi:MAG: porin [Bacteroidota bacterium]